jgi:hypothetical protein
MTREETKQISDRKLDKLIAEVTGGSTQWNILEWAQYPPAFSTDLNVIQRAEGNLTLRQYVCYVAKMMGIVSSDEALVINIANAIREAAEKNGFPEDLRPLLLANCVLLKGTARQRAEALAMVLTEADGA